MPDPRSTAQLPTRPARHRRQGRRPLGELLVDQGAISPQDLVRALAIHGRYRAPLARICVAEGMASEDQVLDAQARIHGARRLGPQEPLPSPELAALVPPEVCRDHALLPWAQDGMTLTVATARLDEALEALTDLPQAQGFRIQLALATEAEMQARLSQLYAARFAAEAARSVPEEESCRTFLRRSGPHVSVTAAACASIALAIFIAPQMLFAMLALWAMIALALYALLKLACLVSMLRIERVSDAAPVTGTAPVPPPGPPGGGTTPSPNAPAACTQSDAAPRTEQDALPTVSLLVPLYKETGIARALVARLAQLDYPRALLDVVLVLEESDDRTRAVLADTALPPWFRVVEVPDGEVRTKPRALNYAFGFCRGEIVGIYDAEDAPAPDQLMRVARRFQRAPPDMACLQGVLDYYNPHDSWLARCFTIEYATWFRLVLPGLVRLGFAIPLGGTTVFLRRAALDILHGWDAHNVTEDADLGLRLARHGFRTEMIATTTREEANDRLWPWVRQRSRWLKGYMVTYLVHMRAPLLLWRQLGTRRFLGIQLVFLGSLSQALLAPVLWTFWLGAVGLGHPLGEMASPMALSALGLVLLAGVATDLCTALVAVRSTTHRGLAPWVPTMVCYFPLAAIAGYKALAELAWRPFFWDKTEHGRSTTATTGPEPP